MADRSRVIFKSGTDFFVDDEAARFIANQLRETGSDAGPVRVMRTVADKSGDRIGAITLDMSAVAAVFVADQED